MNKILLLLLICGLSSKAQEKPTVELRVNLLAPVILNKEVASLTVGQHQVDLLLSRFNSTKRPEERVDWDLFQIGLGYSRVIRTNNESLLFKDIIWKPYTRYMYKNMDYSYDGYGGIFDFGAAIFPEYTRKNHAFLLGINGAFEQVGRKGLIGGVQGGLGIGYGFPTRGFKEFTRYGFLCEFNVQVFLGKVFHK